MDRPRWQRVEFSIGPPEKAIFANQTGFLTVSPDGTKVAFAAGDTSGKVQLWIRPLDSQAAQPLPGTENVNAYSPFWSPDSRFMGFQADGKLKKIAVSGGPAQTLTNASVNSFGTWNRDGVILFIPGQGSPIHRVSAAGGAATAVTTLDASRQETTQGNPYFLPDGKHFLFFSRSTNPENSGIYVSSLDSNERKLLFNGNSNVVYVPPGFLVFSREQTLMAQGFDARRLELTGEGFPIAERVQINMGNATAAFAASDNGLLLYRTGSGVAGQFNWVDRAGKPLAALADVYDFNTHFSLSPDEKRIAVDQPSPSALDLWLLDSSRSAASRFTFGFPATCSSVQRSPVWIPDGSRLIFEGTLKGTSGIFQKLASGAGDAEQLLNGPGNCPTDISRDGRFLLYERQDPMTRFDMWVSPLFGDKKPIPFLQTEFDESHGSFSPDARWVAYTSNESGRPEVYVQPFSAGGGSTPAGSGPQAGKWQISTNGGMTPQWRRDGKELLYLSQGKLMSVEVNAVPHFEAGTPRLLFEPRVGVPHGMYPGDHYRVSADGQRFLIIKRKGDTSAPAITVVENWTAGLKK